MRGVDMHALPFDGAPLVSKLAVDYPLDVGGVRDAASGVEALVVSDPTRDLPATRAEAKAVVDSLRTSGWGVTALDGASATSANVLARLASVRIFHYAGHGVFAGLEGWESALPVHGGGRIALGDVLALDRAPAGVVLSACESARADLDASAESLGLAQAFVAAGAEAVVAPTRAVGDALASKLARLLYEGWAPGAPPDLAELLQRAQVRIAAEDPQADWSSFRVLRP
jgi:CHAT domain-containing protein